MNLIILLILFGLGYYLWYRTYNTDTIQAGGDHFITDTEATNLKDVKVCTRPKSKKQDYYPRYKFWWSHVKDLCTRPPYDRIFPPFWNTDWNPNITSDEYYRRLVADGIVMG